MALPIVRARKGLSTWLFLSSMLQFRVFLLSLVLVLGAGATPLDDLRAKLPKVKRPSELFSSAFQFLKTTSDLTNTRVVEALDGNITGVVQLTDANYLNVLRTGTEDPDASPLDPAVRWAIFVYAPESVSMLVAPEFGNATEKITDPNVRFAKISYQTETALPTRLWMWRVPAIVVTDPTLSTVTHLRPNAPFSFHRDILAKMFNERVIDALPTWNSPFAPAGPLAVILLYIANVWALVNSLTRNVPSFVLLAASGFFMNILVSWLHTDKDAEKKGEPKQATTSPSVVSNTAVKSSTAKSPAKSPASKNKKKKARK